MYISSDCCDTACFHLFFFNDAATTEIYTLSLHDALPIYTAVLLAHPHRDASALGGVPHGVVQEYGGDLQDASPIEGRLDLDRKSTRLELQSRQYLVCRLLLEKKK